MGGSLLYLWETMQGRERSDGKSKPDMGLQNLSQGSRIRTRNREGWAGSRCGVPETETKVCGGTGYVVEDFRLSLGRGDAWIRVPVWCYMECNKRMHEAHFCRVQVLPQEDDIFAWLIQPRRCTLNHVPAWRKVLRRLTRVFPHCFS